MIKIKNNQNPFIEDKPSNKLPTIKEYINGNLQGTIEFILDYTIDCRNGTISYTSDKESMDEQEYTLRRYLTNVYLIARKTIMLYDNQLNRFTKVISKIVLSQSNDILRTSLEQIRDTALDYKEGTKKYSVPEELSNSNKYLFINAMNEIESLANNALTLYASDLINHSEEIY